MSTNGAEYDPRLGERVAVVESDVRHFHTIAVDLGERLATHEEADERRHREVMGAVSTVSTAIAGLTGRVDGHVEVAAKAVPLAQREAFAGMTVREAVSTIGVVLAVLAALANLLRGDPVDSDAITRALDSADHAVTAPSPEAP